MKTIPMMDFSIGSADMVSILVALLCGGIIGFEREYRNKSAGFRTILLITLGSTIFTIVSRHGAGADDRISANIITGIGFIGAGVIFKDQFSVRGLTTAAVIWTSAAIGMTTGIGYHSLALLFTAITLTILLMMSRVEHFIGKLQRQKRVSVTFRHADFNQITDLETQLTSTELKIERISVSKDKDTLTVIWEVSGRKEFLVKLSEKLAGMQQVLSFN